MKKLLILLAAVAVIGGGAFWFMSRPTGVQVQALLTPDGPDVTDLIRWDVDGVVARDSDQGITLGIVQQRTASATDPTFFPTVPGQLTEVDGRIQGNVTLSAEVSPARGEVATQSFVMFAGLVAVELAMTDGMEMRLDVVEGSTVSGYFPDGDKMLLALREGDYTLSLVNNSADLPPVTTDITVVAGDTQQVSLDGRAGTVRLALDAGQPWPDGLTPLGYRVTSDRSFGGGSFRSFGPDGVGGALVLPYGENTVEVQADPAGPLSLRPIPPVTFNVDAPDATVPVPVEFQVARFTITGMPEGIVDRRVRIVEADDKGEYVASRSFDGDTTVIAYDDDIYDPGSVTFAAFLRGGPDNLVVATADLGKYAPGTAQDVTLVYGEGLALCEELFGDGYCLKRE